MKTNKCFTQLDILTKHFLTYPSGLSYIAQQNIKQRVYSFLDILIQNEYPGEKRNILFYVFVLFFAMYFCMHILIVLC